MKSLVMSLALGAMLLASVSLGQDTTSSGKSKSKMSGIPSLPQGSFRM